MTTLFARFDQERSIELKLQDDNVTWWELADEFLAFLQGCGYQVTREDFAEYWAEFLPVEEQEDPVTASVTCPASWGTLTPTMDSGTVTITTTETKTY